MQPHLWTTQLSTFNATNETDAPSTTFVNDACHNALSSVVYTVTATTENKILSVDADIVLTTGETNGCDSQT